jgi:hypothetical protein
MGIERRHKRKKEQDVKKMYEREMRKMATMTDEQRITHLHHLSRNLPIKEQNDMVELIPPVDVSELIK